MKGPSIRLVTRRQLLGMGLVAGGAAAAGGAALVNLLAGAGSRASAVPSVGSAVGLATPGPASTPPPLSTWVTAPRIRPVKDLAARRLVVIDMAGGNDGLSMVPPIDDARYRRLRPRTALDPASVLAITPGVGLHPGLPGLHAAGAAIVQGVGITKPDLSHFEMLRRWWSGDVDSVHQTLTGFLGRLADHVGDPTAAAAGVSLGYGPSPALISERVVTLSMDPYGDGSFPAPAGLDAATAWTAAWREMAEYDPSEPVPFCSARNGAAYAYRFSQLAGGLPAAATGYPETELGAQLLLAARMLARDNGVRIVHVPFHGDFDSHEDHLARHAALMTELDDALVAFRADLAARGIADRVLIATTSEFGRRVPDNASNGLDHGAASFAFLAGPVAAGLYGTYPSLATLDADQDLVATVSMLDYYATIAESWFGVPASDVLAGHPSPIAGII